MKFKYFKFGLLAIVMVVIMAITPGFTATKPLDASTMIGVQTAKWGSNVKISYSGNSFSFSSNGIPNHSRPAEYALPPAGVMLPKPDNAYAGPDPTKAQNYNFTIPLTPTKIAQPTSTSLGPIGIMISGAALFNPYEGDNKSVATFDNFSIKNSKGEDVPFLDLCNGHPTPMGQYHYHALPPCITQVVDKADGPSHIIGVAFDGFPIYGDRAMDGSKLTASQLDSCNGITSPTPEFPKGFYHYVLLDTKDSTSSIRCLTGKSNITMKMPGMRPGGPGMPGMPRGPRPQLG
jgi:hypothetical protein